MTLDEFLAMCKMRDWPTLMSFQTSDEVNPHRKILVSAIIAQYHPQPEIAKKHGLDVWSSGLSGRPMSIMSSMITGNVDVVQFAGAYMLAEDWLKDASLANSIANYVKTHKYQLAQSLNTSHMTNQEKKIVEESFGDLTLNKQEKELYLKAQYARFVRDKTSFVCAEQIVRDELESLLKVEKGQMRISFSSEPEVDEIDNKGQGHISFRKKLSLNGLQTYADILNNLGLNAYAYNLPCEGIQIHNSPQETVDCIHKYKDFLSQAQQRVGFFKVNDVLSGHANCEIANIIIPKNC